MMVVVLAPPLSGWYSAPVTRNPGPAMTRILSVCLGNICRSPSAEGVLRDKALARGLEIAVDSAGASGWHIGDPPHPPATRAASARGYDLTNLRGRQFGAADFENFDLILVMDAQNRDRVEALRPQGCATPVRLMLSSLGRDAEVPDPYYSGDFGGTLDLIEAAADAWIDRLAGPEIS